MTSQRAPVRPSAPQGSQCLILHFLASLGAQEKTDNCPHIAHQSSINVVINWQLSKQGINWPVPPYRIAGSGIDQSRSRIFFSTSTIIAVRRQEAKERLNLTFCWAENSTLWMRENELSRPIVTKSARDLDNFAVRVRVIGLKRGVMWFIPLVRSR